MIEVYQDLLDLQAQSDQQDKKENMVFLDARDDLGCLEEKVTKVIRLACWDLQALLAHLDFLEEFSD